LVPDHHQPRRQRSEGGDPAEPSICQFEVVHSEKRWVLLSGNK
jgi:hypothetical protein